NDEFVHASGLLRVLATNLSKMCGDFLLLSSGPIGGFHEITLPAVQPGSSIMPGKVNPVIVEMTLQCAYQVMGHDATISLAAQGGMLELNAFGPLITYNFFQALKLLRNSIPILAEKCIKGIEPNMDGLNKVYKSVGLVTALVPIIGYKASSRIAKRALETKKPIRELVLEEGLLSEDELDHVLTPERMTRPGILGHDHEDIKRKLDETS
ncbi:MAG: aspartate ammonia-lyase, partial [Candidatus Thorarchaeota archaeon]|nr:aspartate ammonia-lyase [Candidatus Thorarchaeota archaeon]